MLVLGLTTRSTRIRRSDEPLPAHLIIHPLNISRISAYSPEARIADNFEGKPLNSPYDIVPHQDGSIWFTDPPYGDRLNERHPDEASGPTNPLGVLKPDVGSPNAGVIGSRKRELPTAVYRWDPSGKLEVAIPENAAPRPERAALLA